MRQYAMQAGALWLVLMASLSGCGYSVEQLAEDHELRKRVLAECAEQGMDARDQPDCKLALEAQALAAKNAARDLFDFADK